MVYKEITSEIRFILYGAGFIGREIYQILRKENMNVIAFIDKNAHNIYAIDMLPIYTIEEIKSEVSMKNVIIIICTSNIFKHLEISKQLFENGFEYLIFSAVSPIYNEYFRAVDLVYQTIRKKNNILGMKLPKYENEKADEKEDNLILHKIDDNNLCVQVPVFLLFTGTSGELIPQTIRGVDKNILTNPMTIGLYKLFSDFNNINAILQILSDYKNYVIESQKELKDISRREEFKIHMLDRYDIYCNLCKIYEQNDKFFEENPSYVKWNEKGYFNIIDGLNRTGFLKTKGKYFIPCKMSNEDYSKWINKKEYNKLSREEIDLIIDKSFIVAHPYMYKKYNQQEIILNLNLLNLTLKSIFSHNCSADNIYILGDKGFTFAQFFSMIDKNVTLLCQIEQLSIFKKLNLLMNIKMNLCTLIDKINNSILSENNLLIIFNKSEISNVKYLDEIKCNKVVFHFIEESLIEDMKILKEKNEGIFLWKNKFVMLEYIKGENSYHA